MTYSPWHFFNLRDLPSRRETEYCEYHIDNEDGDGNRMGLQMKPTLALGTDRPPPNRAAKERGGESATSMSFLFLEHGGLKRK
ncbi:hypothetical protein WBP06_20345 [Novosphingobium sp. BL-8H]|uniref:hypothetical protein n=1 Tax=Novosphingobium sp. BL-8H TaxID=3127640 RepID=UPI00375814C4